MRILISTLLITFLSINIYGQKIWTSIDNEKALNVSQSERGIHPDHYSTFILDYSTLTTNLKKAPAEDLTKNNQEAIRMNLAMPDGSLETFSFLESSCMHPDLAKKYPNIRSYRGISVKDPYKQAWVDFGYTGFHAAITTPQGTIYIDPLYNDADEYYQSYYTKHHTVNESGQDFVCGNEHHHHHDEEFGFIEEYQSGTQSVQRKSLPVTKRTYRMAIACTGAWGNQQGTVTNVLSKFNTSVNKLNSIYENHMAVRFELIPETEQLIFFPNNDPFTNGQLGFTVLNECVGVINSVLSLDQYDIGHTYTVTCTDGIGGVAALGSLCRNDKARGISCIGNSNVDNFTAGTIAHEVGHQFSGQHVFNKCGDSDQVSPGTGWEPGSGTTILSYGGACGSDNVQPGRRDEYFNVGTYDQFYQYVAIAGCGEETIIDNTFPEIVPPFGNGVVIPISTPFELEGEATDEENDPLTYHWEQHDVGPQSNYGSPIGNAPSFRSLPPSPTGYKRVFPMLSDVLIGRQTPAEVLPTYSRDLTFWFTVHDNHPGGGSTAWEEVKFKASDKAGPFVVTNPGSGLEFTFVGTNYEVEWDVANTDLEPINCQEVDILLSTNGGLDFDVVLAENTPNDGSESVILPIITSENAKIKVKASDNIFFNLGRGEMIIREPTEPGFFVAATQNSFDLCLPGTIDVDLESTAFLDFENPVQLDVISGLPDEATYSFTNNPMDPNMSSQLNIDLSGVSFGGKYEVIVQAIAEGADTLERKITINATGTQMDELALVSPLSGDAGINGAPVFTWSNVINAETYTLEICESPAFDDASLLVYSDIPDSTFQIPVVLDKSTLYYWRVTATNNCVAGVTTGLYTLGTVTLNCKSYVADDLPKNISASGEPVVTSYIELFDEGTLADVNITKIEGLHGRARDLRATLIAPSGNSVELFDRECGSGSNFNLGIDSDAPLEFNCPLNSGNIMQPSEANLGLLNGEEIKGDWALQIEDTKLGEGGQFRSYEIEICANGSFDAPFLVNNQTLFVKTGEKKRINRNRLLSEDANNSPLQLVYTLVVAPEKGELIVSGSPIEVGGKFTQGQIDIGVVKYQNTSGQNEEDTFTFTVIDGEGGWIDMTVFNINIDDSNLSNVEETLLNADAFDIYPNPTNNLLYVYNNAQDNSEWQLEIVSIEGKRLVSSKIVNKEIVNVNHFSSGLYFVILRSEKGFISYKVLVED